MLNCIDENPSEIIQARHNDEKRQRSSHLSMASKLGIKGTAKVERFNSLTNERKLIIIPAAIAALLIERCSYLSVPFPKNTVKNNYTYNSTTILS